MKKYIALMAIVFMYTFVVLHDAAAYIDRDTAVVGIMNKAAGKVQTVRIPVGKDVRYEKLKINSRTCKQTDPFQAEDFYMFVEVYKDGEGQIFGNWMSRNEPGDNPLQNADYDLWLIRCENTGE